MPTKFILWVAEDLGQNAAGCIVGHPSICCLYWWVIKETITGTADTMTDWLSHCFFWRWLAVGKAWVMWRRGDGCVGLGAGKVQKSPAIGQSLIPSANLHPEFCRLCGGLRIRIRFGPEISVKVNPKLLSVPSSKLTFPLKVWTGHFFGLDLLGEPLSILTIWIMTVISER